MYIRQENIEYYQKLNTKSIFFDPELVVLLLSRISDALFLSVYNF